MPEKPLAKPYMIWKNDGEFTSGREPPGGGDLEARVTALEKQYDKLDGKIDKLLTETSSLRTDLAYIKGKVDAMPTTLHLLGFVIAVLGIAGLAKYFTP